jgi:hypothetical protein
MHNAYFNLHELEDSIRKVHILIQTATYKSDKFKMCISQVEKMNYL